MQCKNYGNGGIQPRCNKSPEEEGAKNSWESKGFTKEATLTMILEGRIGIYQADEGIVFANSQ